MKGIFNRFLLSLFLIPLSISCEKSMGVNVQHTVPSGYEGVLTLVVSDSLNFPESDVGSLNIEYVNGVGEWTSNKRIILQETVLWKSTEGKYRDLLKFVNEGICTAGENIKFLVSRKQKKKEMLKVELIQFRKDCGVADSIVLSNKWNEEGGLFSLGPYRKYRLSGNTRIWYY